MINQTIQVINEYRSSGLFQSCQVQEQDWAGALATVNQLVDLAGPDTVFNDGGGTQFTWGQGQQLVEAKAAEANAYSRVK